MRVSLTSGAASEPDFRRWVQGQAMLQLLYGLYLLWQRQVDWQ